MEYRRLGRTGLKLSALSYGAWVNFGRDVGRSQARELIACAYDHGVNFFDNAEGYAAGEAERIMGDALADLRLPRDAWCVSSKVYFGSAEHTRPTQRGLSRKHVIEACHQALIRLRVDHLDLYFCHRPDPDTPIVETVLAMDTLVRQGKVMYWGTSEWPAVLIREAVDFARMNSLIAPSMEQPQYNLFERARVEVEYAPLYAGHGLGLTTWSPLASGLLTGKYTQAKPTGRLASDDYAWLDNHLDNELARKRIAQVERLAQVAPELACTPAQLAIAWCLCNSNVSSVILGASRAAQLEENLGAIEVAHRIDEACKARIESLLES